MSDFALGLRHQFRNSWRMSRAFAIGAIVMTAFLHAVAILAAATYGSLATDGITVEQMLPLAAGLWSALALLPALGGGESDDPMALAAAGAGRPFRFGTRLGSSLTDAGPGLFIPALAIVGAATAGWPGWLAGLALAFNGLAFGQATGAASAMLVQRIGPTPALVGAGGVILLCATVLNSTGIGPGAWWVAATGDPLFVIVLVATGIVAFFIALALNRPPEQALKSGRTFPLPRSPFLAVCFAFGAGVGRSVLARSTLITAVLVPLLVRSGGQELTSSVTFFVAAAAAAVIGANGYAYDAGANVWLLGKADRWTMVFARAITTAVWAGLLTIVAAVSATAVGAPPTLEMLPALVLVCIAAGVVGLVPSIRRPATSDFDSFRAQPAPVASAIGTLGRSMVLTTVVITLPLAVSAAIVIAYAAFAMGHARWSLRDPVQLAALA